MRRYYRQFFDDYMSHVTGAVLVGQWVDEAAVAREDAIDVDGPNGPKTQRVMSVLFAVGDRLGIEFSDTPGELAGLVITFTLILS